MKTEQSTFIRPGTEATIKTGWKNPPTLASLKLDMTDALSHHNAHVDQVNVWLDNLNVTGSAVPAYRKGRSRVVPKLIRKQAEWRYAGLSESFLSHENLFTTEPVTFEDGDAAYQNGLILNNQWNTQINKVAFIDEYVRAAVDEGSVAVKVGWDFEERITEVPNLIPTPIPPGFKYNLVEQGAQAILQDPQKAAEIIPADLIEIIHLSMEVGQIVELQPDPEQPTRKERQVVKNQPTVEVCDYAAVLIDPLCKGDLNKAEFVIYQFETSKSELEKDGRYQNLDKIQIDTNSVTSGSETNSQAEDTGGFNFKDEPRKKFYAYEYWGYYDIDDTGMTEPFVATWVGDVLIRMEKSPFPDKKIPFVLVPYLPKRKQVYGEPDGALLEDNQKIAGAVTRGMLDIMGRSAAGQIGYRKDALDVTNQRKFDKGLDYQFNPGIDARTAFYTHVYPEIPQSAPFMLGLQHNEAEALTGVKAFHEGITGEGLGKSATAARSAIDAAGKRELGILRRLAGGLIEIARKIIAMNAVFLSEEEVVRVTNERFITVNREDLDGRLNIKLKISTPEADDSKAQELAFMLQTVGNSLPIEFSLLIMKEIAELRKMPELAKKIEDFEPTPDPMAQRMQELEIAEKEAEIQKTLSEAEENRAEAALDLAQAKYYGSRADKEDLDFVEQESGVKQEREKELHGEQARANKDLEVTKAALQNKGEKANPGNSPN